VGEIIVLFCLGSQWQQLWFNKSCKLNAIQKLNFLNSSKISFKIFSLIIPRTLLLTRKKTIKTIAIIIITQVNILSFSWLRKRLRDGKKAKWIKTFALNLNYNLYIEMINVWTLFVRPFTIAISHCKNMIYTQCIELTLEWRIDQQAAQKNIFGCCYFRPHLRKCDSNFASIFIFSSTKRNKRFNFHSQQMCVRQHETQLCHRGFFRFRRCRKKLFVCYWRKTTKFGKKNYRAKNYSWVFRIFRIPDII
jgi:hypothetical protein